MDAQESRRKKLAWESILGFVGFFTVLALIQAVWNLAQPDPSVTPAVVLGVLVLALALAWRGYSRYR